MTNAPSERDDQHAWHRDSSGSGTEANALWTRGRGSANPHERHISPDHRQQPHHRLTSQTVPPRRFDSPQQEPWLRLQMPVSSLSHPRPAAEDTERSQRVVHLGDAYYSDHHPRESGFGFQPSMTNYYGQPKDQRQKERPERMEEKNIRPGSRWELDEYESRHRATGQWSMHPNMAPSGQTIPPEHSSHHRRHDSSYAHAPPRHSSRSYGLSTEDARYMAQDRLRQAPYPDEYRRHFDSRNATHRSEVGQKELRHTQERVRDGFYSRSSHASNVERQRHYGTQLHGNVRQSSWETSPAPRANWNHHDTRERRMDSLGPQKSEERMVRHGRESSLEDHYHNAPLAYERTDPYARDYVSHGHERVTGAARQHSEAESGRAQSLAAEEEAKKEKAMNFAIDSYKRGEIEEVLSCGSPYLEQAARILLKKVKAAEAETGQSRWRAKPVLKPVRPATFIGPFIESDEDGDEDEDLTQSGTASGRNPGQDGSSTTVERARPKQATSSGAAQSKLLRDRARHDTPIRAAGYDSDIGILFEGSSASNDQESLFVPKTTPVKRKFFDLESAASHRQGLFGSSRQEPSPDAVIVRDQSPEPSTRSNAAPTPSSMMSRDRMAKMMAERNRSIEAIIPRPPVPQIAKATQPSLAETGDSRERAISISSKERDSPLSDSSSGEHPAAKHVKKPNTATPAASRAKILEGNGMPGADSKKEEREKQQSLESFGEDIMALRAEMARQKQQKREAEDQREQLALSESDVDDDDDGEGEGPQIDTVPKATPKTRGRPPASKPKKTVEKKPAKPVKKKVLAKQLSSKLIASESGESDSDTLNQTQTVVQRRGQENGTLAHDVPISMHNYALLKRKPKEEVSPRVKKHRTSPKQKQPGKLLFHSEDNRYGLPALESPIASPEMKSFIEKYAGDMQAMKAHAPTCAQVLADEMDREDNPKTDSNLRSPRLKRATPPPKPIKTNNLRPTSRKGKAWPDAVHVPIEDQDEPEEPAAKPAQRSPKTTRKALRQGANAPGTDAGVLQDHDGIIMVNQNFTTPPSNRGAHCLPLCEADKLLVKWRSAGLQWSHVRILYANETNRILTPQSLQHRHKRVLEKNPDLAAAAAAAKPDVPSPDDAPLPTASAGEDEEAEAAKPGPGGKSWNMDALEAYYANRREVESFLTDGEDETDEQLDADEQEPRRQQTVRDKTPEPLDKNECWWMYQVWRKSWTMKTEEEEREREARRKEMEVRKTEKAKEKEMRRKEKEAKEKEAKKKEKKEKEETRPRSPGPTVADLDPGAGSYTESESESDTESESEPEEEEEEDDEEVVDPEAAAEPYVAGAGYYHRLGQANDAAGIEMHGARFGIGGIGTAADTGCIGFKFDTGPHGMNILEASFADGKVVRVWVDRFARAPGTADPPDVREAPHGWLAKMVWVVKRKDVEVRRTSRRANDNLEAGDGDAINVVDEESRLLAVRDLATFTVLDGANSEAAQRALDHAYPPSSSSVDKANARIEAKMDLDVKVQHCEESSTTFTADIEGDEEDVAQAEGGRGHVVTMRRVDTTFYVEGAMLQGPRNV